MPLVLFTFVFLGGFSINSENSGGVHSFHEAKADIVQSIKHPVKPDWSKLND